jgi:hypothetical protein
MYRQFVDLAIVENAFGRLTWAGSEARILQLDVRASLPTIRVSDCNRVTQQKA